MLTDSNAKRCPSCRSRLRRRRSTPIVLGETSRLDQQATLAVDQRNQRHRFSRPDTVAVPWPVELDETELFAIVIDPPEPEVEPELVVVEPPTLEELIIAELVETDEPAPVVERPAVESPNVVADAIAAFTVTALPTGGATPAPLLRPVSEPTAEPANDLWVDSLHRKARGERLKVAAAQGNGRRRSRSH